MRQPSYTHGASALPLLGQTIGENLRRTVGTSGDRDALVVVHQGFRATYRELWELVDRCARGLLARGIQKGDRVGIWSPNRYEWVVTQFATARIGAILVTINPAYQASELEYALTAAGVSLLAFLWCVLRRGPEPVRHPLGPFRCGHCGAAGADMGELGFSGSSYVDPTRRTFGRERAEGFTRTSDYDGGTR